MKKPKILLKLLVARQKSHPEQGSNLIETTMAILIATIIIVVSTPPLLLAMANRVQSRRAEQAMQLAQQEIERVRLIVEEGSYINSQLSPAYSVTNPNYLKNTPAPTSICAYPCAAGATLTQGAETRDQDFFVQSFREPGVSENGQVVVFRQGVRVYSKVAKEKLGNLKTEVASIQLSNKVSNSRESPLAVLYVDFTRGDMVGSLLKQREFAQKLQ